MLVFVLCFYGVIACVARLVELYISFLAHQTEIATLFAWVIKLHLTQVFSPRLKKYANLEINQIWGVVVQEKESNMVFCSRWKFPTLGMTVLSGTEAPGASVPLSTVIPWVGNFHLEQNPI